MRKSDHRTPFSLADKSSGWGLADTASGTFIEGWLPSPVPQVWTAYLNLLPRY